MDRKTFFTFVAAAVMPTLAKAQVVTLRGPAPMGTPGVCPVCRTEADTIYHRQIKAGTPMPMQCDQSGTCLTVMRYEEKDREEPRTLMTRCKRCNAAFFQDSITKGVIK